MKLNIQRYVRRPFEVDAVQVTAENMEAIAEWTKGTIVREDPEVEDFQPYIAIDVHRAANERQRRALVGDWVLKAGYGFKIFTQHSFGKSFKKKES